MIFHIEFKQFLEVLFKEHTIFKDDIPHWIQTVFLEDLCEGTHYF